jgi:predicted nucleotidyltransferase
MSLAKIFPNQTFLDLLLFFVLHPKEETYLARIVRFTGKALIQVQRALKRLEESGLITRIVRGGKTTYHANAEHAAFRDLKHLILKAVIFSDKLKKEVSLIQDKVKYGFIFGSTAFDKDSSESDIDLFLIGNMTRQEVSQFSFELSGELMREVNTVICPFSEFKEKLKAGSPFIKEVIASSKIWIFGNEDEFKKVFG